MEMEDNIVNTIKTLRSKNGLDFKWNRVRSMELFDGFGPGIMECHFAKFDIKVFIAELTATGVLYNVGGVYLIKVIYSGIWKVLVGFDDRSSI